MSELFRHAYLGDHPPFQAYATVGTVIGGQWVERQATIVRGSGCARACVRGADGARTFYDDGTAMWEAGAEPGSPSVRAPSCLSRSIDLALQNYRVRDLGRAEIAHVETRVVELEQMESGGAALRSWIDPETNIVLAEERYDCGGGLTARMVVDEIIPYGPQGASPIPAAVEPISDDAQTDTLPGCIATPTTRDAFVAAYGYEPDRPLYLPTGFGEDGLYVRTCPKGRTFAELRYSDGLRTLSVFVRKSRTTGPSQGGRGQSQEWTAIPEVSDSNPIKTARVRHGDFDIAAAGDLPEAELRQVIESCTRAGDLSIGR